MRRILSPKTSEHNSSCNELRCFVRRLQLFIISFDSDCRNFFIRQKNLSLAEYTAHDPPLSASAQHICQRFDRSVQMKPNVPRITAIDNSSRSRVGRHFGRFLFFLSLLFTPLGPFKGVELTTCQILCVSTRMENELQLETEFIRDYHNPKLWQCVCRQTLSVTEHSETRRCNDIEKRQIIINNLKIKLLYSMRLM